MTMFLQCLMLVVGMVFLVKGADFFVDGASSIAKSLKVPSLIIGLTLVSMGTSAPEASVSVTSALKNMNQMCFGNVIGSNIFNTFLILGISAVIIPLVISKEVKKYDIPIMVGLYGMMLIIGFVVSPYYISRTEAIVMLVVFAGYMVSLFLRAKNSKQEEEEDQKILPIWKSILFSVIGIAGIILGGNMVVEGASYVAAKLGMDDTLIGLTIVAIGTSLPELVTSVVAAIKKENDIAVGNVIGSNIFNIIFILGLSAVIRPLGLATETFKDLFDLIVLFVSGVAVALIAFLSKKLNMKKWQGIIFIILYFGYTAFIIYRNYFMYQA